jgi:ArsR family transcriptional regulator
MSKYTNVMKALSEEKRFKLFAVLLKAMGEFYVCEITDALSESQYNISKYLKELKNAGLVKDKRFGKGILYSVVEPDSQFIRSLYDAISSIEDDEINRTVELLKMRASVRDENKCVSIVQKVINKNKIENGR